MHVHTPTDADSWELLERQILVLARPDKEQVELMWKMMTSFPLPLRFLPFTVAHARTHARGRTRSHTHTYTHTPKINKNKNDDGESDAEH